jgi:molybdate transport system substrate-binding protein
VAKFYRSCRPGLTYNDTDMNPSRNCALSGRLWAGGIRVLRLGAQCVALMALSIPSVWAGQLTVAVATNFRSTLEMLASEFEATSGHQVRIVAGSTGQLYAQIINGAPIDVFMAADQERPRLLGELGVGDAATIKTYAVGRLALWSGDGEALQPDALNHLSTLPFRWFAVAEPKLAPYGAASLQVLESIGVRNALEMRIVRAPNVAQTFAMIATGNAELGLVALSQAVAWGSPASYHIVDARLHDPIRQDLIVLNRADAAVPTADFVAFLSSDGAMKIIEQAGYETWASH